MQELTINLHIHTKYSDGSGSHKEIAQSAREAGLDVVIMTDHNVWVENLEGYYRKGKQKTLILIGEEIHDQDREPQKNHLLVLGAERELATLADEPQILIDNIRKEGGLSFIAHPIDPELQSFNEDDISWVDWQVTGFTGIELWNGFSELKTVAKSKLVGLFYAYFPKLIPHGPLPETLHLWDDLLSHGQRVVAVGGSDAHARQMSMGPLHRVIFPYAYHFSTINTHLLVSNLLSGDLKKDREMIMSTLAMGHAFVSNDIQVPARGFRFSAFIKGKKLIMGDEHTITGSATLHIRIPRRAECHLIKDGKIIMTTTSEACTYVTREPGVYRVEVYRRFFGKRRGWIFSNPIYLR